MTALQLAVLTGSLVLVIAMLLAGAARTLAGLVLDVALALTFAVLLNLGTALVVTRGSVAGVACVLAALVVAVPAFRRPGPGRRGGVER